jgi:hypothetical protein
MDCDFYEAVGSWLFNNVPTTEVSAGGNGKTTLHGDRELVVAYFATSKTRHISVCALINWQTRRQSVLGREQNWLSSKGTSRWLPTSVKDDSNATERRAYG